MKVNNITFRLVLLILLTTAVIFVLSNTAKSSKGFYYSIHVASHKRDSGAEKNVSQLRAKGYDAFHKRVNIPGKGDWYRIYIGQWKNKREALTFARKLKSTRIIDSLIIHKLKGTEKIESAQKSPTTTLSKTVKKTRVPKRSEESVGGFSFVGIDWNDTPYQVQKKMIKNGLTWQTNPESLASSLNSFKSQDCIGSLDNLIGSPMIDKKKWDYLRDKSYLEDDHLHGKINRLKKWMIDCKDDSIVKYVAFFFTREHKLLSYMVTLNIKFTDKEKETGEGDFYRSLVEKYGPPSTLKWSKKWSKKGQSLYYFSRGPTQTFLVYVSEKNVNDKLAQIQKKREELKRKSKSEESGAVKKVF